MLEIPVVIKTVSETVSFEIAIIENVQRQNLSSLEEAEAYKKLIDEFGHTQESLSQKIGKSRSFVANTMRLLRLPDEVKQLILDDKLSAGHARTIVNSDNPLELARKIIENNLSVRETEALLKKIENSKNNGVNSSKESSSNNGRKSSFNEMMEGEYIQQIEEMLHKALKTPIKIRVKNNKCQVIIKCGGMEQLDAIVARLGGDLVDV